MGKDMKFLYIFLMALSLGCGGCNNNVDHTSTDDTTTEEASNITWTECGYNIGDHPCNFSLTDVNGDVYNLYDNYGDILLVDFSTMWCHYCQVAGMHAQRMQDEYGHHGFQYVSVLIEDNYGGTIETSDLQEWADAWGITTAPLLSGDRSLIDLSAENGYPISGWPTFVLINRDMVLESGVNGWSEALVTSWVEQAIQNDAQEE